MKKKMIVLSFMVFMMVMSFISMTTKSSASQWTAADEQQKATGTTAATTENIELSLDENGMVVVNGLESKRTEYINSMLKSLTIIMTGIAGIADIVFFFVLVKNITEFATSGANPQKRSSAVTKILVNVLAIALCGGGCIVFTLLYNALK